MKNFNPYATFKSGKYENHTYNQIWAKDKDYFYFLASKMDYWGEVVTEFERRDKIFGNVKKVKSIDPPSNQEIKELFQKNPILGFDMSDFIVSVYENLNQFQKQDYYESLLQRNNIKV
jgi:hypothetical protein